MSEQKWQRITYMPATPIGEHGERVTGSKKHIALSRRAAREGMVLLKNEGRLLPFAKDAKIAVFGKAQVDYVKGGGGSGDTTVAYTRSILDGLEEKEQEWRLSLFAPLSEFYRADVAAQQGKGVYCGKTVEPEVAMFSAWSPIRSKFVSMSRYSIPFRAEHFLFFKRST